MGPTNQKDKIRILHLEDNPHDSELLCVMLEEQGFNCSLRRVDNHKDFSAALSENCCDIVISDFALPSYDGMKALALTREKCPDTPFILFSGTIGEDTAVESLKRGASDYVLKQRPVRLAPAVRHALKEAEQREQHRRVEEELRRSAEREKQLEARFLRMQRMESIGALVGGIAHDLNNALVPVLMGVGYLRRESLSPEATHILTTMETSTRRGADMLKQVLAFARGVEGNKSAIEMGVLLREMDRIVRDTFPKNIQWRVKVPSGLWTVSGYATQLHQVLMNLCINARDAMPHGGMLRLAADNFSLEKQQAAAHANTSPGPYLRITVADTGTGMAPDILNKIFQPFFTTKEAGKGTGLGLSTSLNIVKNHGGFITVNSTAGEGTEFHVYLPAVSASAPIEIETRLSRLPVGQGECILIIDDETAICEITKATLENYGYRVLVASSGPEAVAIYAEKRSVIALALTDSEMPFMDGRATCLALRKINPDLKIVFASGSTYGREEDTSIAVRVNAFIPKPYTVEKLLTTVNQVLNEAKAVAA